MSRCNLHAARLPDFFWVVEGGGGGGVGGGGAAGGGLQIVNHYVSSSGGELVQKTASLGRGRPAIKWICQTDSQVGARLFPSNILACGFLTSAGKVLESGWM